MAGNALLNARAGLLTQVQALKLVSETYEWAKQAL
jgi:hypothetical protein